MLHMFKEAIKWYFTASSYVYYEDMHRREIRESDSKEN